MMMLITLVFASLVITAALAALSTHLDSGSKSLPEIKPTLPSDAPRFFASKEVPAAPRDIPIEVLVSQIERHVQLEQAAVETFLKRPTSETLHSPSASPLLN